MVAQCPSTNTKSTHTFTSVFAAATALRLTQTDEPLSLLSRRNAGAFLAVAGDYLLWPKLLITRLRTDTSKTENSHRLAGLDDATFINEVCIGQENREEFDLDELLAEFAKSQRSAVKQMLKRSLQAVEKVLIGLQNDVAKNVGMLCDLAELDDVEKRIFLYTAIASVSEEMRIFLRGALPRSWDHATSMLGAAIGVSTSETSRALRKSGRLVEYGFIEIDYSPCDMEDKVKATDAIQSCLNLPHSSIQELMAHFVETASPGSLGTADYPHLAEDIQNLTSILKGAIRTKASGINILLHGAPGTGKTELAKLLGNEVELSLFEVTCKDDQGNAPNRLERLTSLRLAQRFLVGCSNSLVLLDEAEDIFEHTGTSLLGKLFGMRQSSSHSTNSKAWINRLLETNPVPVVWVSNAIHQIDPAALRRFSYILEVRTPPMAVRRRIATKHLSGLMVSDEFLDRLAEQPNIAPALLQNAAKVAMLSGASTTDAAESLAGRVIQLTQEAMGEVATPALRMPVTGYRLDYLNIDSNHPIEKILSSLKLRASGTLCFYGLPGTGKTALAKHIAHTLDRPLITKRVSDLMSKWVGETEQHIAKMFREAENEKAILLLDEADSLLRERQHSSNRWEITQVNEFLQQIESFPGVFICATNLFDTLDAAVLRRFTFKLRFNPMTPSQRECMFVQEALQEDRNKLTDALLARLHRLDTLTPGDFSTVKRQAALFAERLKPEDFLTGLELEVATKNRNQHRAIGFVS